MKWYKHVSDSLDDPFIFSLMDEFGSDGYLVFFGIIEIYAREFRTEDGWKLTEKLSFFRHKLRISSAKIEKILSKIWKWEVEFDGNTVCIFIPKFKELMDESTLKKLRDSEKPSGIVPESIQNSSAQTKTKTETKTKNKEYSPDFESFWTNYPKRVSKGKAYSEWGKIDSSITIDTILVAIEKQKKWRSTAGPKDFRPQWKDPERWIKNQCWNDEVEVIDVVFPSPEKKNIWEFCPSCKREVLPNDIEGKHCIHCAPRKPLSEIMEKLGAMTGGKK